MYQMNGYELVKVHGEGQYPFTYRGENGVLLGRFGKDTYFLLIFHKSRIEKLATITFLSRCSYSPPDVPFYAALFQCRSCPGISPERCLALILAKSYPIFWQVCTCQAARFHTANIHSLNSGQNKSTVRCQPHRQNFFCLKVSLLRC